MTGIKMSDVFDLPLKSVEYQNQIVGKNKMELLFADFHNYEKDALITAINAYDDNQERIKTLEHENALLENQLKNALAEIAELKKKARGY